MITFDQYFAQSLSHILSRNGLQIIIKYLYIYIYVYRCTYVLKLLIKTYSVVYNCWYFTKAILIGDN